MDTILAEKSYTIQEAAQEMNISAHTLRYYEKIGLLPSIHRSENGRRNYTEEDLGWVYWLKLLRESGMSIRVMKVRMNLLNWLAAPFQLTLDVGKSE